MSETGKNTETMLQPYVATQVEQITRFEKKSDALKNEAEAIEINDASALKAALDKRKEINSHIKEVSETRLSITREFDKVKTQFTDAEKRVLKPADEAKSEIGKKILDYEDEQERLRVAEANRVQEIIAKFATNVRSFRTLKSVDERGAELKAIYAELPEADQSNGEIKIAFTQTIVSLGERKDEIRTAEVDAAEAAKIAAKRRRQVAMAEQEADDKAKADAKKAVPVAKTGVRIRTKFKIVDPIEVPLEYCVPSEALIRKAIDNGVTDIPGVEITQERSF